MFGPIQDAGSLNYCAASTTFVRVLTSRGRTNVNAVREAEGLGFSEGAVIHDGQQ
ncbi:MAG TPA: hypothetical protein VIJ53_03870 [Acidobacteriaceae bacterium]